MESELECDVMCMCGDVAPNVVRVEEKFPWEKKRFVGIYLTKVKQIFTFC